MARSILLACALCAGLSLSACKSSDPQPTGGSNDTGPAPAGATDSGETGGEGQARPQAHTPDPAAVTAVNEAKVHFEELAYKDALAQLESAIALDASYPQAHLLKGQVLHANSDYELAIAAFSRAVELDAQLAEAWDARGLSRYWNEDLDGAISDFSRALELDEGRFSAHYNRGSARAVKKDYEGALKDLRRAQELLPADADPDSVRSLIERAEELQGYSTSEKRRGERMDALTGEEDGGQAPGDDPDANDG